VQELCQKQSLSDFTLYLSCISDVLFSERQNKKSTKKWAIIEKSPEKAVIL
jgi:hypothetical protein